ncbi:MULTISPECIES: ArpU family phage packaging/lysis transcriptional regulator [Bacillus]|uniref:ArpU family phage packaging/lysis transcriptional regulator n=1 Tax=Bacillus altitudinis TaxID=293387 RepID=A0ABV1S3G5_BACAB|nr:ArpU family phage packaging/lysis transcriptional regulator [Bacillus safensis]MCY7543917.1 ArpU family transcriptional regulator [Bacillus safensis]MCY7550405.1 ArpU family transcriptional regulator [Bacillus safensis]MCY7644053.1 ArpU family transcriptional regulator [Bacillus safensis]MCY7654509.1 ArpU family transcriptional regulator [Bacillus safensis]MEC3709176.1 ArpU family phage packaging/lysis transcriptional regulator [Bacillus safensis]
MLTNQLCLIPEVIEKQVRKTLINELKLYKALKVKQENLDEQKANGILTLFPKLRDQNVCSELKVRQIERALEYSLDEIEQDIIRMKYLTSRIVKDLEVCEELGLKKDRYYKLKKQATFKLSTALGII